MSSKELLEEAKKISSAGTNRKGPHRHSAKSGSSRATGKTGHRKSKASAHRVKLSKQEEEVVPTERTVDEIIRSLKEQSADE